jgi:hypothetical protein
VCVDSSIKDCNKKAIVENNSANITDGSVYVTMGAKLLSAFYFKNKNLVKANIILEMLNWYFGSYSIGRNSFSRKFQLAEKKYYHILKGIKTI